MHCHRLLLPPRPPPLLVAAVTPPPEKEKAITLGPQDGYFPVIYHVYVMDTAPTMLLSLQITLACIFETVQVQGVFENPSGVDSDALELQALALPIAGLSSSGMFVNYFAADSDASEKQTVQIANLGSSPSNIGLDECTGPGTLALNSTALMTREHQNVLDAFQLLKEDASVQKMVMALSTDKAVWDAVMNNEVVQEFKKSFQDAKETDNKGSSSAPPGMMQWVLENTQAKIKEFLEKILQLGQCPS
ncbi:hypothetical protein TRIUR3_24555 [Triticum urartu]|uniref:Uncharacterized protein n=1 Tax=Triticum urartu TaxID=4572 RepID=M7Z1D4_TRIUA|nr:hypothetical protein TRIUR3_24555 [Triticum urartu]